MEDVHEQELVERCRSGDERAFQELVDRHKDLVFALIARTVQDRSRAEDLARPSARRVGSLNVSAAAAVLLFAIADAHSKAD